MAAHSASMPPTVSVLPTFVKYVLLTYGSARLQLSAVSPCQIAIDLAWVLWAASLDVT
jgi:hypothetical protein